MVFACPTRRASLLGASAFVLVLARVGVAHADEPAPLPAPAEAAPEPLPPALPPPAPAPTVVIVEAPPPAPPAVVDAPHAATPDPAHDTALDDVRFRDAHADRVILAPTAETHPRGTFFFSDYEIALLQLGYAVTDDLQLSLSGVPPIVEDQPLFFELGAKLNVARTDTARAAVYGALDVVTHVRAEHDDAPAFAGRVGGVAQLCFERTCRSSLSFGGGAVFAQGANAVPLYGAVGLVANVSEHVSLLAEPTIIGLSSANGSSGGGLVSIGYGVRFSGTNFGIDFTFVEPLALTNGSFENPFVLGYPFVAFTYRTDAAPRGASSGAARSVPTSAPLGVGGGAAGAMRGM